MLRQNQGFMDIPDDREKSSGFTNPNFLTPTIHPSPHHRIQIDLYIEEVKNDDVNDFANLYSYYLSKEKEGKVNCKYLSAVQKKVVLATRNKACEIMYWLHRVMKHQFGKTFVLAMRLFDRVLSAKKIPSHRDLYRLCITCIFLAGKFEECYLTHGIKDIIHLVNNKLGMVCYGFNEREFLKAEKGILQLLNFRLSLPTLHDFVAVMTENVDIEHRKIIRFLTIYGCRVYCLLRFRLSVLSFSLVLLSELIFNDWDWNRFDSHGMSTAWGHNREEVRKCARILWSLIRKNNLPLVKKVFEIEDCFHRSIKTNVSEVVKRWSEKQVENELQMNNNSIL